MATICDTKDCGKPAKRYSIDVSRVESNGDQIKVIWFTAADLCIDHLNALGDAIDTVIPPTGKSRGPIR